MKLSFITQRKHIVAKIVIISFLMLLFLPHNIQAQDSKNNPFRRHRWFMGGNLGIQFGTMTILDVSPYTGYKMTNSLSLGAGFTYQYIHEGRGEWAYTSNVIGGRIFSSYKIIPELFAYAEYEVLNFEVPVDDYNMARKNVSSVLVGAGYRQIVGPNLYSDIMILWNLTDSPDSPYTNPIYRVGLVIGL